MRERGHRIAVVRTTVVRDLLICCAMELNDWRVVPAGTADGLNEGVQRLLGRRVAVRDVRVERTRVRREDSDGLAQPRIASEHVDEPTTVAHPAGEDAAGVDAVASRKICQ